MEFIEDLIANKKLTNQQIESLVKQELKKTVEELMRRKTK
jgi:hypothetical protein